MGCVQAALLEKEAALRALAQDNRERAQRMEALQALVRGRRASLPVAGSLVALHYVWHN